MREIKLRCPEHQFIRCVHCAEPLAYQGTDQDGYEVETCNCQDQAYQDTEILTGHNSREKCEKPEQWETLDKIKRLRIGIRLALSAHIPGKLTDAERVELNALLKEFDE